MEITNPIILFIINLLIGLFRLIKKFVFLVFKIIFHKTANAVATLVIMVGLGLLFYLIHI
jgi:hypothetical protein